MNTRNVQNGPGLVIVQQIQISCFFTVENPVEHVDSNHVSSKILKIGSKKLEMNT